MYVADWEEFMAASVKLFNSNPAKTRYCMKFRGEDKVVVLKVTDDKVGPHKDLLAEFPYVGPPHKARAAERVAA